MKAGGVAKAICDAGGESIQKECNAIIQKLGHPMSVSQTAVTNAGHLKVRDVIHVVGPRFHVETKEQNALELREAILNVLRTARLLCDETIFIPPVSSGLFGFPKQEAVDIIFRAITDFYLYMYNTNQGVLTDADIKSGLASTRYKDRRSQCNSTSLVPSIVHIVAFHSQPDEIKFVAQAFAKYKQEELLRRQMMMNSNSTYSINATNAPTPVPTPLPPPTTPIPTTIVFLFYFIHKSYLFFTL